MNRENYKLVEPSQKLKNQFINMAVECEVFGETRYQNWVQNFEEYLQRLEDLANGKNCPDGVVPANTYFLVSESKMLGRSSLRHRLNSELEIKGGHIGYDIRPTERQKGFGTLILKLTLEKARQLGLKKVLITCDTDNIGSLKIIEKNGGILDKQIICKETKKPMSHYWINL